LRELDRRLQLGALVFAQVEPRASRAAQELRAFRQDDLGQRVGRIRESLDLERDVDRLKQSRCFGCVQPDDDRGRRRREQTWRLEAGVAEVGVVFARRRLGPDFADG
jgi:hypothetical protein